jgi:hypothetical protein
LNLEEANISTVSASAVSARSDKTLAEFPETPRSKY